MNDIDPIGLMLVIAVIGFLTWWPKRKSVLKKDKHRSSDGSRVLNEIDQLHALKRRAADILQQKRTEHAINWLINSADHDYQFSDIKHTKNAASGDEVWTFVRNNPEHKEYQISLTGREHRSPPEGRGFFAGKIEIQVNKTVVFKSSYVEDRLPWSDEDKKSISVENPEIVKLSGWVEEIPKFIGKQKGQIISIKDRRKQEQEEIALRRAKKGLDNFDLGKYD